MLEPEQPLASRVVLQILENVRFKRCPDVELISPDNKAVWLTVEAVLAQISTREAICVKTALDFNEFSFARHLLEVCHFPLTDARTSFPSVASSAAIQIAVKHGHVFTRDVWERVFADGTSKTSKNVARVQTLRELGVPPPSMCDWPRLKVPSWAFESFAGDPSSELWVCGEDQQSNITAYQLGMDWICRQGHPLHVVAQLSLHKQASRRIASMTAIPCDLCDLVVDFSLGPLLTQKAFANLVRSATCLDTVNQVDDVVKMCAGRTRLIEVETLQAFFEDGASVVEAMDVFDVLVGEFDGFLCTDYFDAAIHVFGLEMVLTHVANDAFFNSPNFDVTLEATQKLAQLAKLPVAAEFLQQKLQEQQRLRQERERVVIE